MYAVIGMQLLNNRFYYCNVPSGEASEDSHISSKTDCFDVGGNWIN
jgi:hypothetical protein